MHHDIILFDLDGTLTDSGPGIMKAGQYALRAFGIELEQQGTDQAVHRVSSSRTRRGRP